MQTMTITGGSGISDIIVGGRLDRLADHISTDRTVIITDSTVAELYGNRFPDIPAIAIGTGEGIKTLDTVAQIMDQLVKLEMDRSATIVGIGGGIVCDITGFVASTYLRGVRFGFVATTLLAQVDASVGGKNGVNFEGYKNMVGVFNQPDFVICDDTLLTTLSDSDRLCGLAEIVKHAAIADPKLFDYLEANAEAVTALAPDAVQRMVSDSVRIKSDVVNQDEREAGIRRILNFGHTLGHALEKTTGIAHGHAVSIGMVAASAVSVRTGRLSETDHQRLVALLETLNMPTHMDADPTAVMAAMRKDKKREGDHLHLILLDAIGHAVVESVPLADLEMVLHT